MIKEYLARTKNGHDVFVDMESSHAATHLTHHPHLIDFVKKVIPTVEVSGDHLRVDVDMGEEVGLSDLVETTDGDEIVYAKRPFRNQYSRFVKQRAPVATSWVTIDIRKDDGGGYYLYTAFIGKLSPSFPGGTYLPDQSKEFWSRHALVWGPQEVVPGTETTKCPW